MTGKVKSHLKFRILGGTEVFDHVLGPLVRFRQQYLAGKLGVHRLSKLLKKQMRFRQVLAVGAFALVEIGNGVAAKAIQPEVEPEARDIEHLFVERVVVVVEIGLVIKKPVPEVLICHRIEGPVRRLGVDENDARSAVS